MLFAFFVLYRRIVCVMGFRLGILPEKKLLYNISITDLITIYYTSLDLSFQCGLRCLCHYIFHQLVLQKTVFKFFRFLSIFNMILLVSFEFYHLVFFISILDTFDLHMMLVRYIKPTYIYFQDNLRYDNSPEWLCKYQSQCIPQGHEGEAGKLNRKQREFFSNLGILKTQFLS